MLTGRDYNNTQVFAMLKYNDSRVSLSQQLAKYNSNTQCLLPCTILIYFKGVFKGLPRKKQKEEKILVLNVAYYYRKKFCRLV